MEPFLRLDERRVGDEAVADNLARVLERLADHELPALAQPPRELHVRLDDPPPLVNRRVRFALRVSPERLPIAGSGIASVVPRR